MENIIVVPLLGNLMWTKKNLILLSIISIMERKNLRETWHHILLIDIPYRKGGKIKKFGVSISLDPPYSPWAYLNHQNIYREDYVMHFIHDLSPHIKLSKTSLYMIRICLQNLSKRICMMIERRIFPHKIYFFFISFSLFSF